MKIAIYDNLANNAYIQAKAFRRRGIAVDLVLDPRDTHPMSDPRWEDADLELPTGELASARLSDSPEPAWVRREPPLHHGRDPRRYAATIERAARTARAGYEAWRVAGRYGLEIEVDRAWAVQTLREYDIVIGYGAGPAFAALAGVPCLAQTWGGDITILPFEDENAAAAPVRRAEGRLQRWGYQRAARVLLTDPRFFPYAERLGVADRSLHLPFVVDTAKYSPGEDRELRERFLPSDDHLLVFVPSRQDWHWKGSDRMLKGFAGATRDREDVVLVCAGWGVDIERSTELASRLGIDSRVRFLPYAMSKTRLLRYYRAADVVMDQFTIGSYGTSALEAMSCGRPLLIWLDPERFRVFDEFPPIANARTPEEIAGQLSRLFEDSEHRATLGDDARRWVVQNHGDDLVDRVARLCREVAGSSS